MSSVPIVEQHDDIISVKREFAAEWKTFVIQMLKRRIASLSSIDVSVSLIMEKNGFYMMIT